MRQKLQNSSVPVVAALLLTGLFGSAAAVRAQLIDTTPTIVGNAKAVQATAFGNTTVLADTGTLGGTSDAREASQVTGGVPSVLAGEVLHAVTIGWPDQVASEASIANLGLTVAGTTISADLVIARALAATGGAAMGNSGIDNLSVNGIPVYVTGEPNQTVWIPGGQVIVNEQKTSSTGILVNALRVVVTGVADIVIASATAGIH
ncbi:MAG: hypothetical protein DMG16_05330 [Acidobacteria bacterium]|nr:MAG: hypothetical protein DMG16_05330 [Acidobacteriota bacterium]